MQTKEEKLAVIIEFNKSILPAVLADNEANGLLVMGYLNLNFGVNPDLSIDRLQKAVTSLVAQLDWQVKPQSLVRRAEEIDKMKRSLTGLSPDRCREDRMPTRTRAESAMEREEKRAPKVLSDEPLPADATPEQMRAASPEQLRAYMRRATNANPGMMETYRMDRSRK
jgi:hypothetical protein